MRCRMGGRVTIGPFELEFVNMAHSIPETSAVTIRTALGTVLHSADWKLDADPGVGLADRRGQAPPARR